MKKPHVRQTRSVGGLTLQPRPFVIEADEGEPAELENRRRAVERRRTVAEVVVRPGGRKP